MRHMLCKHFAPRTKPVEGRNPKVLFVSESFCRERLTRLASGQPAHDECHTDGKAEGSEDGEPRNLEADAFNATGHSFVIREVVAHDKSEEYTGNRSQPDDDSRFNDEGATNRLRLETECSQHTDLLATLHHRAE